MTKDEKAGMVYFVLAGICLLAAVACIIFKIK